MALLTDEELMDTLETQLPALLKRHPEFEMRVYSTFLRTFATREEVVAVLSELRELRDEFDEYRVHVDKRFDRVEDRLDRVEDRLDRVEVRLDRVEDRLDRMGQQFSDLRDWVEMIVGRFQTRSGRKLEDVVAGTMRLVLGRDDVLSEHVRLRQPLEDAEGMIGPAGRRYEVDILVHNSALLVFEVKSVCELEDVDRFADKVALMRTLHPEKAVDGVIVTMAPLNQVEERCADWGLQLVR